MTTKPLAACAALFAMNASAAPLPINPELTPFETSAKAVAVLAPRTLAETHNNLTIGCETLDRDYADYHKYKEDLTALGIRKIRLMAGWAKTEREKGIYDFEWLDAIIDDAIARGLVPWLETSYGNPIYEGGGTKYLAGGWPTSSEALYAWDNWVRAMAERYKGQVREWEIWNEPDINPKFNENWRQLVDLQIRTAEILREVDPEAKIAGFAWANWNPRRFSLCMDEIRARGKLDLFDWISFHFYEFRPEAMYAKTGALRKALDGYSTRIKLRQGETGAPSKRGMGGILADYDWSEISQGKWALRRMIGDRVRDIDSTIFCICDMNYFRDSDHIVKKNVKGLLESDEENNIVRRKQSYYAVQNLVSVWDSFDQPVPDGVKVLSETHHTAFAFKDPKTGRSSFAFWNDTATPTDEVKAAPTDVRIENASFSDPVCVDIRTGVVYETTSEHEGSTWTFKGLPGYDSPVYVIDRDRLKLR